MGEKKIRKKKYPKKEKGRGKKEQQLSFCIWVYCSKTQTEKMEAVIEERKKQDEFKTPRQRLRERCRNGSKNGSNGANITPKHLQIFQTAKQMGSPRKLNKKIAENLAPDEYLLYQKLMNKKPVVKPTECVDDSNMEPIVPQTTTSDTSVTFVIDPLTHCERPRIAINSRFFSKQE